MYRSGQEPVGRDRLVLERNHGLIIQTERSHSLQPALGLGHDTYRAVAVHGVAIFSQVPASALASLLLPVGSIYRNA